MKAWEVLNEKPVESTWIADLMHNRQRNEVTMKLSDGKLYRILGIKRAGIEKWQNSPSKGTYFHDQIAPYHQVTRIN